MKFKKLIIAVVALITFGTIGQTTINHPNNIQAKTNSAVFPKKMRGTWYHYDNDTKQVEKYVYTKKKRISYADYKKVVNYLHAKPKNDPTYPKHRNNKDNWIYILGSSAKIRGRKWISIKGWYQETGGPYYNVSKLEGHQVLTIANGAGLWGSEHWYRSADLAKKLNKRHYPHFTYNI